MKRSVLAFVTIVCVGVAIAVVWRYGWAPATGAGETAAPADFRAEPARTRTPVEAEFADADADSVEPREEDPPDDGLSLGYHCPEVGATLAVHGSLSGGCVAALERRYGGLSPLGDYILPFEDPLTERRIYEAVSEKRADALTGLVDETCSVPQGSITPALADRCGANAMVEHALLLQTCHPGKLESQY